MPFEYVRKEESMNADHVSASHAVTRRTFVGIVGAVLAAGSSAVAQQPAPGQQAPRVKGPAVWLDMDQAELDAAYDQSKYAPNLPQIVKRYATNSEAVRARLGAPRRLCLRPDPYRSAGCLRSKARERANQHLHSWRGLARGSLQGFRVPG